MNKKVADRTYLALKYLYLNSKDVQSESSIKEIRAAYPLAYAKEFCSIKLTTARHSGHSSALARFINEYYDKNWVLISVNQNMSEKNIDKIVQYSNGHIAKCNKSFISYENGTKKGKTVLTSFASMERDLRGLELNGILVDCACFLTQTKIDELYKIGMACMAKSKYQFFIFVE